MRTSKATENRGKKTSEALGELLPGWRVSFKEEQRLKSPRGRSRRILSRLAQDTEPGGKSANKKGRKNWKREYLRKKKAKGREKEVLQVEAPRVKKEKISWLGWIQERRGRRQARDQRSLNGRRKPSLRPRVDHAWSGVAGTMSSKESRGPASRSKKKGQERKGIDLYYLTVLSELTHKESGKPKKG